MADELKTLAQVDSINGNVDDERRRVRRLKDPIEDKDAVNRDYFKDVKGNINSDGFMTGKKVGVYAYLDSPEDTTVITAGTYYPIVGDFINTPIESFEAIALQGITYKGELTQYFKIDWSATVKADSPNTTVTISTSKNDVLCDNGQMSILCKTAGESYALSGICVYPLSYDDGVKLVLTSDGNGDVITIENFTTSIIEFFD